MQTPCVSNVVVRALRDTGHEVFVLREHIPKNLPDSMVIAKAQALNAIIQNSSRRFTPEDAIRLHTASRDWLTAMLAEPFAAKTVVVTHHFYLFKRIY